MKKNKNRIFTIMLLVMITFSINNPTTIKALPNGDLNGDGVIDAFDLEIISKNYNSKNTSYDFNGDSAIDIYDYVTVSKLINKEYLDNDNISIGNTVSNLVNYGVVAKSGNYVYYSNDSEGGKLYKVDINGYGRSELTNFPVNSINVIGDWIYFCNLSDGNRIYKIKRDGSMLTKIINDNYFNFTVSGGWIYYQSTSDYLKIYKAKLDGSSRMKITDDLISYYAIKGNNVYYVSKSDNNLYCLKNDGTNKVKIGMDSFKKFCIYKNSIYYINANDWDKLYSLNLDGSNNKKISEDRIMNLNVNNDWIYFSSLVDNKLYKIKIDGTNKIKIGDETVGNNGISNTINTMEDWIYYGNSNDNNRIYKIKNDGSGKKAVDKYRIPIAVVNTDTLNFRSGPGTNYSTISDPLKKNDRVQVLSNKSTWYKVRGTVNNNTLTGYIYGPYVTIISDDENDSMLGVISSKYESNGDPGEISNNPGDIGGKSYGAWQLSANMGSLDSFLRWLKNENITFYNQLIDGKNKDGGKFLTAFDSAWTTIANNYHDEFLDLQHAYTKYAFYDNVVNILNYNYGVDYRNKSFALKNVLWSTAVQHGVTGAKNLFLTVGLQNADRDMIIKVYDERSKVDIYFYGNSDAVKQAVKNRFISEKQDALNMYDLETEY